MWRTPCLALCGVLAISLASCAGGSGGATSGGGLIPADPAQTHRGFASQRTAKLTITLPGIQPANEPIDWPSRPNRLSAATRSVAGSIGNVRFGPIAISSSATGCGAASGGLSCSISVRAPAGLQLPLVLSTYASAKGTGPALATGSSLVNVLAGQQNFAAPPVLGVARALELRPLDASVRQGTWQPEPLVVYGIDAAGAPIPSGSVLDKHAANPVGALHVVLSGFVNETLAGEDGAYRCCGIVPTLFAYDGRNGGTETFTVSASGYPARTTRLRVLPGPATSGTIVARSSYSDSPGSVDFIAQYSSNAQGNAAPVRTFLPPSNGGNALFGEDLQGNFWSGGTHLSNTGAVLGAVDLPFGQAVATDSNGNLYAVGSGAGDACAVYEYRANHYGKPAPIREIDVAGCPNDRVAVDRSGNVFVSVDSQGSTAARIYEYPPGSESGAIAPTRTISMPLTGSYDSFSGIDTDAAGNLYALFYPGMDGLQLLEFAPGSTSPKRLLARTAVQSFAVDDGGGIYARVYAPPGPGSLEFFPPGSASPAQRISGPATQLYDAGAILVPRS